MTTRYDPQVEAVIQRAYEQAKTHPATRTWESTATIISRLIGSRQPPTPSEQEAIDIVYDCAATLSTLDGTNHRGYVDEITALTTPRQRFLAFRHTPPDSAHFRPLAALIDAVVRADPTLVVTNGGIFTRDELSSAAASITPTEIRFPRAIVNGNAVYRNEDERAPEKRQFGADLYVSKSKKEWWES